METGSSEKFVKLISKEGESFEVPIKLLKYSSTLTKLIELDSKESKHVYEKDITSFDSAA